MPNRAMYLVIAVLALGASAAHAKPGDFAENSAAYREVLANCSISVMRGASPEEKDRVARKLEDLKQKKPEQYRLQIDNCRQGLLDQQRAQAKAPDTRAGKPAYVPLSAAAPAGKSLSADEERQLSGLLDRKAEQVLGRRPPNSRGFVGTKKEFLPENQFCTQHKVRAEGGTFVRVDCSRRVY